MGTASLIVAIVGVIAAGGEEAAAMTVNPSSSPRSLLAGPDTLYFVADDGLHGEELWALRADTGCALLADIAAGTESSAPHLWLIWDGCLYFTARTSEHGYEPWIWNPRRNEARMLLDLIPGPDDSNPEAVGANDRFLFISCSHESGNQELYALPFNAPQEPKLLGSQPMHIRGVTGPDGTLYAACGSMILETDGNTAAFHVPVSVVALGSLALLNGRLFYPRQRTRGDGQPEIVTAVLDLESLESWALGPGEPVSDGVHEQYYAQAGGLVYFVTDDEVHGREVWCTDGSAAGTRLTRDIWPGTGSCNPYSFTGVGTHMFFLANDNEHGQELWVSEGTFETTRLVRDLYPGTRSSNPWSLVAFDEVLAFCAATPAEGEEVWISDGTESGTRIVSDAVPGPDTSGPHHLCAFQGKLFYSYDEPRYGEELWTSDGTPEGTRLVQDIRPPRFNPSTSPKNLTALGQGVCFVVGDVAHGEELWFSDGSGAGTRLVSDIAPGPAGSKPRELCACGDTLYFSASAPPFGRELWFASGDGRTARLAADVLPGPASGDPIQLTHVGTQLFFTASIDGRRCLFVTSPDTGLWTRLPLESPEPAPVDIAEIFAVDDDWAYFLARGEQEWIGRSDGTPEGTRFILDVPDGGILCDPDHPVPPKLLPNASVEPGDLLRLALLFPSREELARKTAAVDGVTYFVARAEHHGAELWRTDGTPEGTALVADAFPGRAGSSPDWLVRIQSTLYFVADHPSRGRVLWRYDGLQSEARIVEPVYGLQPMPELAPMEMAAAGDRLFMAACWPISHLADDTEVFILLHSPQINSLVHGAEVAHGDRGSWPRQLTPAGGRLFFTANDGIHGEELFWFDAGAESPTLVRDILTPADLSSSVAAARHVPSQ